MYREAILELLCDIPDKGPELLALVEANQHLPMVEEGSSSNGFNIDSEFSTQQQSQGRRGLLPKFGMLQNIDAGEKLRRTLLQAPQTSPSRFRRLSLNLRRLGYRIDAESMPQTNMNDDSDEDEDISANVAEQVDAESFWSPSNVWGIISWLSSEEAASAVQLAIPLRCGEDRKILEEDNGDYIQYPIPLTCAIQQLNNLAGGGGVFVGEDMDNDILDDYMPPYDGEENTIYQKTDIR
jgi:hypothetical protein